MGLRAVLLLRREGGGGRVYGGEGGDMDELAATVGDARELGADIGMREPELELAPLLLDDADIGDFSGY